MTPELFFPTILDINILIFGTGAGFGSRAPALGGSMPASGRPFPSHSDMPSRRQMSRINVQRNLTQASCWKRASLIGPLSWVLAVQSSRQIFQECFLTKGRQLFEGSCLFLHAFVSSFVLPAFVAFRCLSKQTPQTHPHTYPPEPQNSP